MDVVRLDLKEVKEIGKEKNSPSAIKSETEPGQELLLSSSKKSSHDQIQSCEPEPSHELAKDEYDLDQKSPKKPLSPSSSNSCYEFIGDLANANGEAIFVDGSRYQGTWDSLGMAGAGSYRMPHDCLYEGEIRDGMQHGRGSLEYPGKQVIGGVWNRGELKKWKYTFSDGLVFEKENWDYCRFPDRRFYESKVKGLKPAGRSLKTQNQPTKVIPLGCYDSGDGIFDPSTLCVTNFEKPSKIIRIPSAKECEWIIRNCRKGGIDPTGYRPSMNKNWSSNPPDLPYRLPMSSDSPERWWKRIFTFNKDSDILLNEMRRSLILLDQNELDGESGAETRSEELRLQGHPECVCVSEPEPEGEYTVCGDQDSGDLSITESQYLREVICEKMTNYNSDQEYEGEYNRGDDLLMTVCCPPEATILRRRRSGGFGSSKRSTDGAKKKEEASTDESSVRTSAESKNLYGEEKAESFADDGDEWGGEIGRELLYCFGDDFLSRDDVSLQRELNEAGTFVKTTSKSKKRKPGDRSKRTKKAKEIGLKTQKKQPCPVPAEYREQLLQRKVGDLLFSPALEAPRSPVYLVRKNCDKKSCKKLKTVKKYDYSKCGVSSSPGNLPANKKPTAHICKEDNKKLSAKFGSQYNENICYSRKLFVTIEK